MDEEQVDVIKVEPLQGGFAGGAHAGHAVPFPVEFRRHEDFFARDARLADGLAHAGFVAVIFRRVDMTIADAQGLGDPEGGFRVVHRPSASAMRGVSTPLLKATVGASGTVTTVMLSIPSPNYGNRRLCILSIL